MRLNIRRWVAVARSCTAVRGAAQWLTSNAEGQRSGGRTPSVKASRSHGTHLCSAGKLAQNGWGLRQAGGKRQRGSWSGWG